MGPPPLILGSEVVAMLDRFQCDMKAFLTARLESHLQFHHRVPSSLTIVNRKGCYLTVTRRMELERIYADIAEATP